MLRYEVASRNRLFERLYDNNFIIIQFVAAIVLAVSFRVAFFYQDNGIVEGFPDSNKCLSM